MVARQAGSDNVPEVIRAPSVGDVRSDAPSVPQGEGAGGDADAADLYVDAGEPRHLMPAGAGVEEELARHPGPPEHVAATAGGAGLDAGAALAAAAFANRLAGRQIEVGEDGRQAHGRAEFG